MRTAVAVIAMVSGKLWFFTEALFIIVAIKIIKGLIR